MRLRIPLYAKEKAKKALILRAGLPAYKKFGLDTKQAKELGIFSGVKRAKQIISNESVSLKDAKHIAAFYSRFKGCKTIKCEGAIDLWGGRQFGKKAYDFVKSVRGGGINAGKKKNN